MTETAARLLKLLTLLQARPEQTGAELAEQLGISGRTVRKDVERLRDLGYPVHAGRGSAGGYRLGAGTRLPPLLLQDDEAVAVAIGLRTAAGGTIAGVEEASAQALAKLEQVLPPRLRSRVGALQRYAVPVPLEGPRVDGETLALIASAARDHERLRFDYRSHGGDPSRREVEPYRLVNWGRRWYLIGYDGGRQDWRTFRVDRLELRTPNGRRFVPRELPEDAVDRVMRGVSSAAWRHRATVTVHAPAEVVADRINPAVGTVEAVDDRSCRLHTGADSLDTLAVHLGLLGTDFSVTEPAELVALVAELSGRYRRAVSS